MRSPRPSFPVPSRLGAALLSTLAATVLVPACNAVLDNRVGVLDMDGGGTTDAVDELPTEPEGSERDAQGGGSNSSSSSSSSSSGGAGGGGGNRDAAAPVVDAGEGDADAGLVCPPCALFRATSTCVAGACAIAACDVGFADCDANPANGCEADLAAPTSCDACNAVCPVVPHATATCVAATCRLTCVVGRADCNADGLDGCEADLTEDKRNCGACGTRCLIGKCRNGVCSL